MSSDKFNSSYFRRKDPVLRFSNHSEIKSIINRYENNDRVVTATRTSPPRPASYCGDVNMIYADRAYPMEEMVPYSDTTDRAFQNMYYDDDSSKQTFRFWPLNALMQFVLCFMKCWLGIGTTSFALMCVIVIAFAPKILTDIFIYPCCRLLFGTLYPAYASYKAIRTKNVKEYVKWMMYWIVFALFTCAETFTDVFLSWLPFYYEIKVILVFWLLSPAFKGSSILYRKFVHPALCRREQEIDECISKAKEQGYHTVLNLGSRGVNYATNVLMQTALKSGGGLVQQLRKSYSLSDLSASEDHSDGHSQQEIDEAGNVVAASDPRLVRRTVSVRGRSPRTFSSPKVDMDFPEMDVLVGHNSRTVGRDMVKLSQIRSSEDISSSFVPENATDQDLLMRTSSVGGSTRMRSKVTRSTFTSIKRPGAAEDGEVIIEEVDDRQIPFSLDYFADNIASDFTLPGGTNCVPPMNNPMLINQYMNLVKEGNISECELESEIELNFKKYLALKQLFESHGEKGEIKDDNTKSTIDKNVSNDKPETIINNENNLKTEIELSNTKKEALEISQKFNANIENTNEKEEISKTEITSKTEEINKTDEISKTKENSKSEESSKTEEVSKTNNNLNDNISSVNLDTIFKEDLPVTSPEKEIKEIDTNFNIGGSLLSLNSINENDSSGKQKKRRAPLPPVNQNKVVDGPDQKSSDKSVEVISLPTGSNVNEENVNILENQDLQQNDKSKEIKSKKNKQDSSISKLLHLPSKLAFWNKSDENINKSSSDISKETASNLPIENIDSNLSDLKNSIIEAKNILKLQKLSTSLDSINDAFEDACEIPENDNVISESEFEKKSSGNLSNEGEKTKPNTRHEIASLENRNEDIQHIPLKLDTLVLHTESKSTDV